jgi:hypothetical protein
MSLSEQALDLLHRQPGRKRISSRRPEAERDHRPVEPAHVIQGPALAIRIKHMGATADNAKDENHATTLGQMLLRWKANQTDPSGISRDQFTAAGDYRRVVVSHHRLMGVPSANPRATDLLCPGKGIDCSPEPDQEVIDRIRGEFRNCRRVLLDCGAEVGAGSRINKLVYAVCIEDVHISTLQWFDFGNLRNGLNALARYFK